ncbi:lymphocyte cytosolic protein 2 [Lycodopsis pacificus]
MSWNNVPSKAEVLGWSPQRLADYMRRLKLSGCDKLVMKDSMSGAQFMEMTTHNLQVFPSLYVPLVTKIQSDINKGDQKKAFRQKSKAPQYPKQVLVQKEENWDSDEFDSECDDDYEGAEEDGYICALTEPQTAEQQDGEETYEETSDSPSSADTTPPRHPRVAKVQDSHCRDPVHKPTAAERTSKPSLLCPPRVNHTPQRPFKAPEGSAVKAPGSSTYTIPKPRVPKPRDVSNRAGKVIPVPPVSTEPAKVNSSTPGQSTGLDLSWYGGKVTRHQAEVTLREVNKDGAFVVRDSSHGKAEHPYTLMLLKQGKVYNIKIRNQGDSYSLGTGLRKTQSFPGVKQMITYHTDTPLQLIDATDQSAEAQSYCCLLHPAGL